MSKSSNDERSQADLRAEIQTLREDFDRLSEKLVESGSDQVSRFAEELREAGERALASAGRRVEAGRRQGEDQVVAAREFVRDHPLAAVACAVGIGYILARLQGRDR